MVNRTLANHQRARFAYQQQPLNFAEELWSPYLQPAHNLTNSPVDSLPVTGLGTGMWVEVSVPYVDLLLENPPPRAPWLEYKLENGISPRRYYSQITWVDQIKNDSEGNTWHRVNERYGNYGDIFWAAAEAFRPLTKEEIAPINPEVEVKRILVDITYQTMACFEGKGSIYFFLP